MSAVAPAALTLRVTVSDVWRTVAVRVPAGAAALEVKQRALLGAGIDPRHEVLYELKFGGGVVGDSERLDAAGVPDGAALVVLPRRRRAVR
ncbi:MAG: hypothetical protein ABSB58_06810 [Gemmatimonadales bacterium]